MTPNPSIERTCHGRLRLPRHAAHVEHYATNLGVGRYLRRSQVTASRIKHCLTIEAAVEQIARLGPTLVAIDGLPCSGKSTLAERLRDRLRANCLALDEFVLPERDWPRAMTPAFPFEYIRYGTFVDSVRSLATTGECRFLPFDWNLHDVAADLRTVKGDAPVIVEGVSALNPEIAPLFDVRVFVESDRSTTLAAAVARGVGLWEREWRELFLPSADLYMATAPQKRADLLVAGRGL